MQVQRQRFLQHTLRLDQNSDQLSPELVEFSFHNVLCTDDNQMLQERLSLNYGQSQITGSQVCVFGML
jgi:hypothetical protein